MLILDYIIPRVLTPDAINAKIQTLNAAYAVLGPDFRSCPPLDPDIGVVNMWTKAFSDLRPPVVGFEVGFLRDAPGEIVLQGKNRDDYNVFIYCVARDPDEEIARQQCSVLWEAVRMVLDDPTSAGLEGQPLPGVVPQRGITKLGPTIRTEVVTLGTEEAGKRLAFRSMWTMTVDTQRS